MQKSNHYCALNLWKGSSQEPGERTKKDSGSEWNALIAIGRRGRILVYLAYGRRAKWIPVESTTQPTPTDIVQPREGRCSSSNNKQGRRGLCVLYEPDNYRNVVRVNDDGQINANADGGVGADKVPHEVVTKADGGVGADGVPQEVETGADKKAHGGLHGSDKSLAIAQHTLEEKTAEYLADVEAYTTRILHLETLLAGFRIRPDGSSSSAPLIEAEDVDRVSPTVHISVQVEKDAALEQATSANLNALELSTTNQELQRQLEVLRQNPFEAKNQA